MFWLHCPTQVVNVRCQEPRTRWFCSSTYNIALEILFSRKPLSQITSESLPKHSTSISLLFGTRAASKFFSSSPTQQRKCALSCTHTVNFSGQTWAYQHKFASQSTAASTPCDVQGRPNWAGGYSQVRPFEKNIITAQ